MLALKDTLNESAGDLDVGPNEDDDADDDDDDDDDDVSKGNNDLLLASFRPSITQNVPCEVRLGHE